MVDNVQITEGSGSAVAADEITDATLGVVKVQYVKLMDGTLNGSVKAGVSTNGLRTESKVSDGTTIAAVKAASTAPVASDPALVVALSPNGLNANGQTTMANSAPVVVASNQSSIPISNIPLSNFGAGEYETVAASVTAQVIGAGGAVGDYIEGILVIPATLSPGAVTLLDNAISIPLFVGGASSLLTLHPFFIPLGMISVSGAWKITTGANVSCIAVGNFT